MNDQSTGAEASEGVPPRVVLQPQPSPRCLLQIARGFSCSFWGIPLTLLLFFGAVDVHVMERVRLPAYILGVLLIFIGFTFLHRSKPVTRRWKTWARQGLTLSFILVYFSPFVYWWSHLPFTGYYVGNMLALVACATWLMFSVNRLAAETGMALQDRTFAIEADLCGWSTVGLMMIPLLITTGLTLYYAGVARLDWITEWVSVQPDMPIWLYGFFLIPITLTMTSAWKAKEICIRAIASVPPLETRV